MIRHSCGASRDGVFACFHGGLEDWRAAEVEGSAHHPAQCRKMCVTAGITQMPPEKTKAVPALALHPKIVIVEI